MDRARALGKLMQDPSLRFSETGRRLLHWLEAQPNAVADWQRVIDNVPEHWLEVVADLARDNVRAWSAVVSRLERRTPGGAPRSSSRAADTPPRGEGPLIPHPRAHR